MWAENVAAMSCPAGMPRGTPLRSGASLVLAMRGRVAMKKAAEPIPMVPTRLRRSSVSSSAFGDHPCRLPKVVRLRLA